jgi:DNA gyrase inhibitor GyrI
MRRVFAIAASVTLALAAGEAAMTQTPNQFQQRTQIQPKLQTPRFTAKTQTPSRGPDMPLIKPSQALIIAQRLVPDSKGIGVKLLPGGNYAVTLRRNNQLQRVIIDGDTGAPR